VAYGCEGTESDGGRRAREVAEGCGTKARPAPASHSVCGEQMEERHLPAVLSAEFQLAL
jgi:hypothetical protein